MTGLRALCLGKLTKLGAMTALRGRVLVTDGVHPLLRDGLTAAGLVCDYVPEITLEETRGRIAPYMGIIINSKIVIDKAFIDAAPLLKFIGRLGSGMEIVDVPYARARGIAVCSAPEGNRNAVGEHALGMLLMLANKLREGDRAVRTSDWNREAYRGWELMGKTVGIVGFGHTGANFAQKLMGFGVQVLAYDKYRRYYAEGWPHVRETTLEEIQERADIISLHLPLTAETHHLFDAAFLAACRRPLVLVNTSRGKVVDTHAVIAGLRSGQLIGACLDVFENEKPTTYSEAERGLYETLYAFEQTVFSPHVAGWTVESKEKLAAIVLEKILRSLQ